MDGVKVKGGVFWVAALPVATCLLLSSRSIALGFVLMGEPNGNEAGSNWNYTDDLGAPKSINRQHKRSFRWNIPDFVYSFDSSFVNYFGTEGMDAVHEAAEVLNDFFVNDVYQGMSNLDLEKHGFSGNYNTAWINTTAQNAQVIDIKSLTLGMMVHHLGLGNPHRHAFTIVGETPNPTGTKINISVALRNYDPKTHLETDVINGVQYSYRLIHDAIPTATTPPAFTMADMEEFTTDTSGNAWSSVAAIVDSFYGATDLFWTDTPSLFNFGVYYDSANAMGGQTQPRHTLTYDDAGGLKFLYSKHNIDFDLPDPEVFLVKEASFVPASLRPYWDPNTPLGSDRHRFWPRQEGPAQGMFPTWAANDSPFKGYWNPGAWFDVGAVTRGLPAGAGLAEGIDIVQFHHQPFDSLLGQVFSETNFTWNYSWFLEGYDAINSTAAQRTYINDAQGRTIGKQDVETPGIQWLSPNPDLQGAYFWSDPEMDFQRVTQGVGRNVTEPDMLFVVENLGTSTDLVPIGFGRDWPAANFVDHSAMLPGIQDPNEIGPGNFLLPNAGQTAGGTISAVNARFAFAFHKIGGHLEDFEVLWSGEASVVGNQEAIPTLWAHVRGPGPNDIETFPKDSTQTQVWNNVIPTTNVPTISFVSDNFGDHPIEENTLTRTEETLSIVGSEMASVTSIEIMTGDLVIETISPVGKYLVSNSRIDVPPGVITDYAEGVDRQIRVWNSVGASLKSTQKFAIVTGRPVITGTSYDNFVFDRAQPLEVTGYGFKSKTAGETVVAQIRVDDVNNAAVEDNGTMGITGLSDGFPYPVDNIQILSDTKIVLPIDAVTGRADGTYRRLRVARRDPVSGVASDLESILSPATNPLFTAVTTKPVISSLSQFNSSSSWERIESGTVGSTGMYKRDRILEINGTALNTVMTIEITKVDGSSFASPVFIQLPNAGVAVEDNGTRIQVAANVIPWADADSNASSKRAFKIYNAVDNSDLDATQTFVVNTQPVIDGHSNFDVDGYFNRDKTYGDDLGIFGTGFSSVSQVILVEHNNTANDTLSIDLPAPGITVTDTVISFDKEIFQLGSGADTDVNSSQRIIKLTSARADAISSMEKRFHVGTPPSGLTLSGLTNGNYTRHNATMGITGLNLGLATKLEITDQNGNPIAGVPAIITGTDGTDNTGGTGLSINSGTSLTLAANATGWLTTANLFDSVTGGSRRIKITTPYGSTTSTATVNTGSFTVSAVPTMLTTAQATFAGGGYTGDDLIDTTDDNGTYDQSDGDLVINGTNFRGVSSIELGKNYVAVTNGTFTVDPVNPPAGFTFSADGTKITINKIVLPAGWIGIDDATVKLFSVADSSVLSGKIQTQP